MSWQDRNPDHSFSEDASLEAEESKQALICPVTGSVMQKYRISYDSDHYLDYSPAIGGVWLDKGEWEYLKAQNLAGSLSRIFTAQWQRSIRNSNARLTFTDLYREKFGEESYSRIKEVRKWLNDHPRKADLRAYLLADDPYSSQD
jgi:Zn-finger nucleic acid-binding protein